MNTTVTVAPFTQFTLTVAPGFNYKEAIDRFTIILEKFENNQDSVSQKIFNWGIHTMEKFLENPKIDETSFLKNLAEKIEEFKTTISVDPIHDPSLVEHPSHEFAKEIFSFIQEVTAQINRLGISILSPSSNELALFPSTPAIDEQPLRPEYALMLQWQATELAKKEKKIAKLKKEEEWMKTALMQVDRFVEASRINTCRVVQQAQIEAELHTAELAGRIQEIENLYSRQITQLQTTIGQLDEKHQEDLERLNKRAKAIDQTNTLISDTLKTQVDALNQQHKQTITTIQRQITTMQEAQQQEISCLKATHYAEASSQNKRIANLQTDLTRAQQINKNHEAANAINREKITKMQEQLTQMYNSYNNSSGGVGCVIS